MNQYTWKEMVRHGLQFGKCVNGFTVGFGISCIIPAAMIHAFAQDPTITLHTCGNKHRLDILQDAY